MGLMDKSQTYKTKEKSLLLKISYVVNMKFLKPHLMNMNGHESFHLYEL